MEKIERIWGATRNAAALLRMAFELGIDLKSVKQPVKIRRMYPSKETKCANGTSWMLMDDEGTCVIESPDTVKEILTVHKLRNKLSLDYMFQIRR